MTSVVHIVQRMAPGGIETLVLDLATRDARILVVSLEGDAADLVAQWPRLDAIADRLVALGKTPGVVPNLVLALAAILRRSGVIAIVAHHVGPLIYGGIAARLAGIATRIHVEHDAWHYEDRGRARLSRVVDFLVRPRRVAVSEATAHHADAALAGGTALVIPNGVDLEMFRLRDRGQARLHLSLPVDVPLVGSVGRLVRVKGHDLLIEACRYLSSGVHVALAGDGPELAPLRERAARLGLADRVHFLGHVDRPEDVYPAFDVFCLPSRAEGFPRSLIEAQACGIPVVATDVGGVREAVCPGTGRVVAPEHPRALASALAEALELPVAPARSPPATPRAFVDPGFSLDRTVAAYRALAG